VKLSVIIPFYNELETIQKAVQSVLINKTSNNKFEILICNDGPLEESLIRSTLSYKENKVVKVLKNVQAKGPAGARNTGLDFSSGDIIAFLDADDYWLPNKIKTQLDLIKRGFNFSCTSYRFNKGNIKINPIKKINSSNDLLITRGIGTSSVVLTKDILGKSRFNNDLRFAQDFDFWFNLSKKKQFKYGSSRKVFVEYNVYGSSKSKFVQLYYFYKVLKINRINLTLRIRSCFNYIFNGLLNHYFKKLYPNKYQIIKDDKIEEKFRFNKSAYNYFFKKQLHKVKKYLLSPDEYYHNLLRKYKKKKVLEIGSGIGENTAPLIKMNNKICCTDISAKSIHVLNKRFSKHKNFSSKICEMEKLPFRNSSFDIVCGAGILSYSDAKKSIMEFNRVLKLGGAIILMDSLNENFIYRLNRYIHYLRGNRSKTINSRIPDLNLINYLIKKFGYGEVKFFGSLTWLFPLLNFFLSEKLIKSFSDWFDVKFNIKKSAFKFTLLLIKKV
jgi:glycosyltransferase involved in cell wall biosynthesis